jgi:hypothetical protein
MSTDQNNLSLPLQNILSKLKKVKYIGSGRYMAECPAHDDAQPSLSVSQGDDGRVLLKCFAGCQAGEIVKALGLELKDLFASIHSKVKQETQGCTLAKYAELKGLPVPFLRGLGISNFDYYGNKVIKIPYRLQDGSEGAVQYRIALQGENKFRFRKGSKPFLYGLDHDFGSEGYVIIVEGPSDTHTLLLNKIPVLGLPSAESWNEGRDAPHLEGIDKIFVWIEPDKGGEMVKRWLSSSRIRHRVRLIRSNGFKDASELFLHDREKFKANMERLISEAIPWQETETKQSAEQRTEPTPQHTGTGWPVIAKQAFYGIAGEFVRLVEPRTEADPVALLVQFLSAGGNVIGPNVHFRVEADKHYPKINPILVGETSKGRKGTSLGYIKSLYQKVDPDWAFGRLSFGGLSSGEGLVWEVRDPIWKKECIKEKGRVSKEFQDVLIDEGVQDKRLMVVEAEFSSTLRVMGRDGNTLSPTIRQSWDDSNLRILTKNNPARSTGCHISIIGHITRDELRRCLDRSEMGNGFANRFLWVCVRRSKSLPEGSCLEEDGFKSILGQLMGAIEFGRSMGEIRKDDNAKRLWASVYTDLSAGKPGLIGAVISRAEAQVMRLACLYAVLDKSRTITTDHLLAALALWDYCEASARYIWQDATGDLVADRILAAIKGSEAGLSRTEIRDLFSRHEPSRRIDLALSTMEALHLTQKTKEDTGGRPVERWTAI